MMPCTTSLVSSFLLAPAGLRALFLHDEALRVQQPARAVVDVLEAVRPGRGRCCRLDAPNRIPLEQS